MGRFPTASEHRALADAAAALCREVRSGLMNADDSAFVRAIADLDRQRFNGPPLAATPKLGQPLIAQSVRDLVLCSVDPHAFTLFVMNCWYDAQESYVVVWSRRLAQLASWITSDAKNETSLPSARSGSWTRSSAWKTWERCKSGGFAGWMISTILQIAESNPSGNGNTYRFFGRLAHELTTPGADNLKMIMSLESGHYAPAEYKRAWMVLMLLRRDQGVYRCFVERSLARLENGEEAARLWYDDSVFPQLECELPVDKRMYEIGSELFGRAATWKSVFEDAHSWGNRHSRPASMLDALFYSMDEQRDVSRPDSE